MSYDPEKDGVDHINVYSRGSTVVGQFLSNFAHSPVETQDGHFESLEGYWYWLLTRDDRLRDLHGFEAKQLGRSLPRAFPMNNQKFKKALRIKVETYKEYLMVDPHWCNLKLPLVHYYVYDGKAKMAGGEWMMDYLEELRLQFS